MKIKAVGMPKGKPLPPAASDQADTSAPSHTARHLSIDSLCTFNDNLRRQRGFGLLAWHTPEPRPATIQSLLELCSVAGDS